MHSVLVTLGWWRSWKCVSILESLHCANFRKNAITSVSQRKNQGMEVPDLNANTNNSRLEDICSWRDSAARTLILCSWVWSDSRDSIGGFSSARGVKNRKRLVFTIGRMLRNLSVLIYLFTWIFTFEELDPTIFELNEDWNSWPMPVLRHISSAWLWNQLQRSHPPNTSTAARVW